MHQFLLTHSNVLATTVSLLVIVFDMTEFTSLQRGKHYENSPSRFWEMTTNIFKYVGKQTLIHKQNLLL